MRTHIIETTKDKPATVKVAIFLKGGFIMSKIAYIIRPITNGMYNDTYTVYYTNGTRRRYTINGAMNKKHFEFIQSAIVESFYSKWTGAHKHDIFRPAPAEETTAEEPAAVQEPEEVAAEEDQETKEPEEVAAEEPVAVQEPAAVQKTSYTVINTITGMFYGTYRNKKDALKRRTWARKIGYERNSKYNVHVIKNYIEVNYGDDPHEIEKINRANIVTY